MTPKEERSRIFTVEWWAFENSLKFILFGMMKIGRSVVAFAIACTACFWSNAAQSQTVVERERFACIVDNIEKYLASETDPVLIFLDFCPDSTVSIDQIISAAENSALPALSPSDSSLISKVISLTKKELHCIGAQFSAESIRYDKSKTIFLPKNICKK